MPATSTPETPDLNDTLRALTGELQALRAEVATLRHAQARRDDLYAELGPIGREVMAGATETLGELEAQGWFDFGRELFGVAEQVVAGFSPEDVRALGAQVVPILQTVRGLTQPEVMSFAQEATRAVEDGEGPASVWDLLKARNDKDVQHGLAVLLSLVRHVGRAARGVRTPPKQPVAHPAYSKLAQRLGASRPRPAPAAPPRRPAQAAPAARREPRPAPAIGAGPVPMPDAFAHLSVDANGHLSDPQDWSRDLAAALAEQHGIAPLTDDHWTVIDFARADYAESRKSPNVRRVATGSGVGTKALYTLFPRKPGVTIARIAGVPKPIGCI